QHTLDIDVPVDEVERRLDEVVRRIQQRASLPGFRRGRVPLEMVRVQFADVVEREFLETWLPRLTGEAIEQSKLTPAVPPLLRNVRFNPGQPLQFEAVVDVRPEVEARDYRKLPIERHEHPVTEESVENMLGQLREEAAVFVDLDRPAGRGDIVLLDSTRLDANGRRLNGTRAKGRRIELGASGVPPDLENALLGSQAGQERTVEISYPADHPTTELAGKSMRYVVQVRKIQEKKLKELDDNFAREVFQLPSMEELRKRVRQNLESEESTRRLRESEGAITEELLRRNSFELPERLVEHTLERVIAEAAGGREVRDELRTELSQRYRPGVERSLRREVLLDAVAKQEKLAVSDDEVAAEIQRMADSDPRQAARVRARYQAAERREALRETLLERKALHWLIEVAEVRQTGQGSPLIVPAAR
ncbi:MAG: trigger factor, partial [Candidatus Eiseniibacteriota bacterium]